MSTPNSSRPSKVMRVLIACACLLWFGASPLLCVASVVPMGAQASVAAGDCHPCCPQTHPVEVQRSCCAAAPETLPARLPLVQDAGLALMPLHAAVPVGGLRVVPAATVRAAGNPLAPPRLIALRV